METIQIPASEVTVGMKFLDKVRNGCDPLYGTEVVKTVTSVTKVGNYIEIIGIREEPDFLGNLFKGGPAVKSSYLITIVK